MRKRNLDKARRKKNDEFYTRLEDIDKELSHYKDQLEDKVIYCNCDYVSDTNKDRSSNFWNYFVDNFRDLKLKKVIATYKTWDKYSYAYTYNGEKVTKERLKGDGDFRSNECIDYLKCADIVITNPPFSLFREYVAQLIYVCDTDKQEEIDELVSILITRADSIGLETNPIDIIEVYEHIKTNSNDTIPFSAFTNSLVAFVSDLEEEEDEYKETHS